jgi:hypothetical protein
MFVLVGRVESSTTHRPGVARMVRRRRLDAPDALIGSLGQGLTLGLGGEGQRRRAEVDEARAKAGGRPR